MNKVLVVVVNHSKYKDCWKCNKSLEVINLKCLICDTLIESTNYNYFELFGLKEVFAINLIELQKNYISLQQIVHPDKYVDKSKREQQLAIYWSSFINNAYQILNNERKRAEYLLSLQNIIVNSEDKDNVQPDLKLLEEIMEIREKLADLEDSLELQNLANDTINCINKCYMNFNINYQNNKFTEAAMFIIKARYYEKIMDEIALKRL